MPARGFGVALDSEILIRTVSDSERAAQVNGLAMCFGVMPEQCWSDEYVDYLWHYFAAQIELGHHIVIVPVSVDAIKLN